MPQQQRRNRFILGFLSLGLLVGAALTGSPAQAVDGPGPYYAEPAWDQKMVPVNRFVVLTDWNSEAVLDKETGLVWERSPGSTTHSWLDARVACADTRTTGNRKGWRLPSMPELASLVDPTVIPGPTLPAGHPFLTVQPSSDYWSASKNANKSSDAWDVDFGNGDVTTTPKTTSLQVWCVRGGMNAEVY